MKNKAIFLDRDGTINVDFGYTFSKDNLVFTDGVIDGLKKLSDNGYILIIVTNQSGIGRKYYSEEQFLEFQNEMNAQLENNGVHITDVFYCPHTDYDNCSCRKPKTKMYYDAMEKYDIDFSKSYAIGDKERDLSICSEQQVTGILFGENSNKNFPSFDNWEEISNYILNKND